MGFCLPLKNHRLIITNSYKYLLVIIDKFVSNINTFCCLVIFNSLKRQNNIHPQISFEESCHKSHCLHY